MSRNAVLRDPGLQLDGQEIGTADSFYLPPPTTETSVEPPAPTDPQLDLTQASAFNVTRAKLVEYTRYKASQNNDPISPVVRLSNGSLLATTSIAHTFVTIRHGAVKYAWFGVPPLITAPATLQLINDKADPIAGRDSSDGGHSFPLALLPHDALSGKFELVKKFPVIPSVTTMVGTTSATSVAEYTGVRQWIVNENDNHLQFKLAYGGTSPTDTPSVYIDTIEPTADSTKSSGPLVLLCDERGMILAYSAYWTSVLSTFDEYAKAYNKIVQSEYALAVRKAATATAVDAPKLVEVVELHVASGGDKLQVGHKPSCVSKEERKAAIANPSVDNPLNHDFLLPECPSSERSTLETIVLVAVGTTIVIGGTIALHHMLKSR